MINTVILSLFVMQVDLIVTNFKFLKFGCYWLIYSSRGITLQIIWINCIV